MAHDHSTLPGELIEQILAHLAPVHLPQRLQKLAPYALVDRLFLEAVDRELYRRIHLLPVPTNTANIECKCAAVPSLSVIARNPSLGRYTHVFENWLENEQDLIDCMDANQMNTIAIPAIDSMTNLQVVRLTPTKLGVHFLRTLHTRHSSLTTIHIIGVDPRKMMWDPIQVHSTGSLRNLTTLRWTFTPLLFTNADKLSNHALLIEQVTVLIGMAEICCPGLQNLHLDSQPGNPSRAEQSNWMLDMGDDFPELAHLWHRVEAGKAGIEPCKLTGLQRLVLNFHELGSEPIGTWVSGWSENAGDAFRAWAPRFFGPALGNVRELELGPFCMVSPRDLAFVRSIYVLAGLSLRRLVIRGCKDSCDSNLDAISNDSADHGVHALSMLAEPFSCGDKEMRSLQDTLECLEIEQLHGLFNRKLAVELQKWKALKVLSLGDDPRRGGVANGLTDGMLLYVSKYRLEHEFLPYLPAGIERIRLQINATPWFVIDFSIDALPIFKALPALRQFHLVCPSASSDMGYYHPFPKNEVHIHRLPVGSSKSHKRLVSTFVEMVFDHSHQRIVERKTEDIGMDDDGEFKGSDETTAWTFDEDALDLISTCPNSCWTADKFWLTDPLGIGSMLDYSSPSLVE